MKKRTKSQKISPSGEIKGLGVSYRKLSLFISFQLISNMSDLLRYYYSCVYSTYFCTHLMNWISSMPSDFLRYYSVVYSLLIFALTWWAESLHYLLWVFLFGFNLFLWWTHCYFGSITIKLVTIYFNNDHVSIVGLVAIKLFINYWFTPVLFLLQLHQIDIVSIVTNLPSCCYTSSPCSECLCLDSIYVNH